MKCGSLEGVGCDRKEVRYFLSEKGEGVCGSDSSKVMSIKSFEDINLSSAYNRLLGMQSPIMKMRSNKDFGKSNISSQSLNSL
jgi:hypothetical protein